MTPLCGIHTLCNTPHMVLLPLQLVVEIFGAADGRISRSISFSGPKLSRAVHVLPIRSNLNKGDPVLNNQPRTPTRHFRDGFVDAIERQTPTSLVTFSGIPGYFEEKNWLKDWQLSLWTVFYVGILFFLTWSYVAFLLNTFYRPFNGWPTREANTEWRRNNAMMLLLALSCACFPIALADQTDPAATIDCWQQRQGK